jgi:hypothetical protein
MQPVDLTVTVDRPMPGAQARILNVIDPRLRALGYAPRSKATTVQYRPRFTGLVITWLNRRLRNEHVAFTFDEQGPVTEVRASGRLRDRARTEVTEALGGD